MEAEVVMTSADSMPPEAELKRKLAFEYWVERKRLEGELFNQHYRYYYTRHFDLSGAFYTGRKVLDIGCGPRGSLEWAENAACRIGLDPQADLYQSLGTNRHAMVYVVGCAEDMPFPKAHFDVVCSFNSIDHVDDLQRSIGEIQRVLAPGGLFLMLTDVHEEKRVREPQTFSWNVVEQFEPGLQLVSMAQYERKAGGMYESIQAAVPFDHENRAKRPGVLSAKFRKPGTSNGHRWTRWSASLGDAHRRFRRGISQSKMYWRLRELNTRISAVSSLMGAMRKPD